MLAATVSMSSSESDPSAAEWAVRKRSTMARVSSSLKEERRWAVRDEKKSPLGAPAVAALADEAAAGELLATGGGDDFAADEAAAAAGGERTTGSAAGTGDAAAGEALPSAPSAAAAAHPRRYWLLRATGYWLTSRSNSLRSIVRGAIGGRGVSERKGIGSVREKSEGVTRSGARIARGCPVAARSRRKSRDRMSDEFHSHLANSKRWSPSWLSTHAEAAATP